MTRGGLPLRTHQRIHVRSKLAKALQSLGSTGGEFLSGECRLIHPLKRRADLVVQGYNFDLEAFLSRIESLLS